MRITSAEGFVISGEEQHCEDVTRVGRQGGTVLAKVTSTAAGVVSERSEMHEGTWAAITSGRVGAADMAGVATREQESVGR